MPSPVRLNHHADRARGPPATLAEPSRTHAMVFGSQVSCGFTLGRTRWGSAEGVERRAAEFEPGPPDARGLFQWPAAVVQSLDEAERATFQSILAEKVVIYSDYSGMDSYRHALDQVQIAYHDSFPGAWPAGAMSFVRACDRDQTCQQILMTASKELDQGRSCVFNNILDRLDEVAKQLFEAAEPAQDAALSEKVVGYQSMLEWLLDNRAWAYAMTSECVVHGGRCPVHPSFASSTASVSSSSVVSDPDSDHAAKRRRFFTGEQPSPKIDDPMQPTQDGFSGPIYMNTSGMTCVAWSSVGSKAGHGHESEKFNHTWLCERLKFAEEGLEHLFFGECTAGFPVDKLRKLLTRLTLSWQ